MAGTKHWQILIGRAVVAMVATAALAQPETNKIQVAALVRVGTSDTMRVELVYRRNQLVAISGYPGATGYRVFAASLPRDFAANALSMIPGGRSVAAHFPWM